MATGHAGSWWGLPDYGITEKIADFRDTLQGNPAGSGRTPQGGSDLDGSTARQAYNQAEQNYQNTVNTPITPVTPPTNNNNNNNTTTTNNTRRTTVAPATTQDANAARLAAWRAQGGQGDVPVGWNPNDQGAGSPDWGSMLNDAYSPFVNALQQWQGSILQGQQEDQALVGKQYSDTQSNLDNQQKTEQAGLDEQGRALWESFRRSMGEGAQNYSQRLRGLINLYGLGNSTGQTMSQILANKQASVEGNLQEQRLSGERALALEGVKLSRYINDKKNQLDTWKQQTMNSIAQNVRDKLNQINQMRGEAEINKTNAKIALLQQTIAAQKQVEAQDQAFRQNLAQWSVQQLANVQQDNFDVSQVPQVYYNTLNQLNALAARNPAQGGGVTLGPVAKNSDEFASLMG